VFPLLLPLTLQLSQDVLVDTEFLRGKSAVLSEINEKSAVFVFV